MSRYIVLIVIVFSLLLADKGLAEPVMLDTNAIDAYIQAEMGISRIPGLALGIIQGGEIIYLQGYGKAGDGRPVRAQTPFIIGSLSKSLTAVAAMQLVDRGLLLLDEKVQHYLPWFTMAGDYDAGEITVRQLLVQTSGIPNLAGLGQREARTLVDEVKVLSEVALANSPGERFEYSNTNYIILGLIIETVTGRSYADYIQTELLTPLEMNNTYFAKEDGQNAGMAKGQVKWFGFPFAVTVQYLENSLAAGFIISDAEDMCRFMLMHLGQGIFAGKTILSEAGLSELHRPESNNYAMGLIALNDGGQNILYHDGATQGFNSGMAFSPAEQWGVIVLTNTASMIELPAGEIALGVANLIQGIEPDVSSRIPYLLNLVVLLFVLVMLILVGRSIILLPGRIKSKRPKSFLSISKIIVLPLFFEFFFPLLVFFVIPKGAGFPVWRMLSLFHPDLVYSVFFLTALILLKGLFRSYTIMKTLRA